MMTSLVARVKFIKIKDYFRYHTKGVVNQVSSNSDHETKSYSCSSSSTKVEKNEKVKKISGLQNGASRGLQIGARGITNRGNFRDFKLEQKDYKSGHGFQIGAEITSRGKRDFKLGQGPQIGAEQRDNYAKYLGFYIFIRSKVDRGSFSLVLLLSVLFHIAKCL